MTHKKFINFCCEEVSKLENTQIENVFIVWSCKTLQNSKALLSTTEKNSRYYEITLNGDKQECYIDVYKKVNNICVEVGDK